MGAKRGKHGIEVGMRSKDAARKDAALILGMNKETIKLHNVKASEMSDDDLAAIAKGRIRLKDTDALQVHAKLAQRPQCGARHLQQAVA